MLMYLFYLWFFYWFVRFLNFIWFVFKCYLLPNFGFAVDIRKYGEWAIITGATDGIGKYYAIELAKRKFNVVLISRTPQKLEKVAKEIEDQFSVTTKCLTFDFSTPDGYDSLKEDLKGLDIGVLVNNVGMSGDFKNLFDVIDVEEHINVLHTNILGEVHLSHFVMQGMMKKKRGIIIHVSSTFGSFPLGFIGMYAPTKALINAFVTNLQKESNACKEIHHQLVTPLFIYTNMTKNSMEKGFLIPDAESFVSEAINTVCIASQVCGCLSHDILGGVLSVIPTFLFNSIPLVKGFQSRCDHKRKKVIQQKNM